eukprot:Platyproteum_vivax@DN16021_c0_g1_i1.p1
MIWRVVLIAMVVAAATGRSIPDECGNDNYSCFRFEGPSIKVMRQKYRTWNRNYLFVAQYTLESIQLGNSPAIQLSTAGCAIDKTISIDEARMEYGTTCTIQTPEALTVRLIGKLFKKKGTVNYEGQTVEVAAGEVKMFVKITTSRQDKPLEAVILKTRVNYEWPKHFMDMILGAVNNATPANRERVLTTKDASGQQFVEQVDVNALFHLTLRNLSPIRLCTGGGTCKTDTARMTLTKEVEKSVTWFGKITAPTQIRMDWTWNGVNEVLEMDPFLRMQKGSFLQGGLNTWAVFLSIVILGSFALVLLFPCIALILCFVCKCCSCITDILCCCCKKK